MYKMFRPKPLRNSIPSISIVKLKCYNLSVRVAIIRGRILHTAGETVATNNDVQCNMQAEVFLYRETFSLVYERVTMHVYCMVN